MKFKINKKSFFAFSGIEDIFGLDLRSLGLARIAIAAIVIFDLLILLSNFKPFFSDEGAVPSQYLSGFSNKYFITVPFMTGLDVAVLMWFVVGLGAAFFLMIGYKTKLANIIVWIVILTIHGRNPFIIQAGDVLLRMILFWGIFLPWGSVYSFDSGKYKNQKVNLKIFSIPAIAYIAQITMVYIFTSILKSGKEWRSEGTAVYYALNIDQFATPIGYLLLKLPYGILKFITHSTYFYETFGPLLLFIPIKKPSIRTIGVLGFMCMHLGFGLGLEIGSFSYIVIGGFAALLPTEFWDYLYSLSAGLTKRTREKVRKLIYPDFLAEKVPENKKLNFGIVPEIFAGIVLVYVFLWNIATIPGSPVRLAYNIRVPAYILRLDQQWDMFSPYPLKNDGWYIIEGTFADGTKKDLMREDNNPISYDKPKWVYKTYKDNKWRKYMMNLSQAGRQYERSMYVSYLCRKFTDEEQTLKTVRMIFMEEITYPKFIKSTPRQEVLIEHECL